jgi:hypothetical protein
LGDFYGCCGRWIAVDKVKMGERVVVVVSGKVLYDSSISLLGKVKKILLGGG